MTQKKLSRYAQKVRLGLVPFRYGERRACPPVTQADARRYESEAMLRAMDRNGWRKPLVRIVRHQGLIDGERRLIPLTAAELRLTH